MYDYIESSHFPSRYLKQIKVSFYTNVHKCMFTVPLFLVFTSWATTEKYHQLGLNIILIQCAHMRQITNCDGSFKNSNLWNIIS